LFRLATEIGLIATLGKRVCTAEITPPARAKPRPSVGAVILLSAAIVSISIDKPENKVSISSKVSI